MLEEPFHTDRRVTEWSYKLNVATVDATLLWLLYLMRTSVSVSRFRWFGLKTKCWQRLQPTHTGGIKALVEFPDSKSSAKVLHFIVRPAGAATNMVAKRLEKESKGCQY